MNDDLLSFADGTQTVVLRRPGSDFETEIKKALARLFRSRRHFRVTESLLPTKSAHWYFSQRELNEKPREGDEIQDQDGNIWTILEVNRSDLNRTWQCVARLYAVVFGLDEYVDHLRAVPVKAPSGTLRQNFQTIKTGIAAKFSPVVQELNSEQNGSLYALVRERLDFRYGDVLHRADGTILKIEKIQYPLYKNGWTEIQLKIN